MVRCRLGGNGSRRHRTALGGGRGAAAGHGSEGGFAHSGWHSLEIAGCVCVPGSVPSPPPLPPPRLGDVALRGEAHGGRRGAWLWPGLARTPACSGGEEWNAVRGGESRPRRELGRRARRTITRRIRQGGPGRRRKRGAGRGRAPFRRRCASLASAEPEPDPSSGLPRLQPALALRSPAAPARARVGRRGRRDGAEEANRFCVATRTVGPSLGRSISLIRYL